MNLSLRSV
jgi:hypothetical protein